MGERAVTRGQRWERTYRWESRLDPSDPDPSDELGCLFSWVVDCYCEACHLPTIHTYHC